MERFPERGRIVPELHQIGIDFLRELVISPYRLLYRIDHRAVHVLAVFDGRRNLEDLVLERALRAL
ncbi:type II toxin-antitoxin system RelE/ParE family toxin [Nitrospira tepida]|uniref:type II toxin-antitoxin system RelE/ParE family toxin n=1 Tax=Nitrospira tepida TaxID=2973512 RepID=UPI00351EBD6E